MQDQVSDAVIASDKWTAYGEGLELRPRKAGTGTGPVVDGLELILVLVWNVEGRRTRGGVRVWRASLRFFITIYSKRRSLRLRLSYEYAY